VHLPSESILDKMHNNSWLINHRLPLDLIQEEVLKILVKQRQLLRK